MTAQEVALLLGALAAIVTAIGGYRLGASEKVRQEASVNESIVKATKELLDPLTARINAQQAEIDTIRTDFDMCKDHLSRVAGELKRLNAIITRLRKQLKDAGIEPVK